VWGQESRGRFGDAELGDVGSGVALSYGQRGVRRVGGADTRWVRARGGRLVS
jgi:hypothetical protein